MTRRRTTGRTPPAVRESMALFATLLVVAVIAGSITVALSVTWRWSRSLATEPEPPDVESVAATPHPDGDHDADGDDDGGPTSVVAWRRIGNALAEQRHLDDLVASVRAMMADDPGARCALVHRDGVTVAAHDSDIGLAVSDAQMLVTAAVALHTLGPDHRFVTEVRGPRVVDGVIDGDLFVVGGGDPVLVSADLAAAAEAGGVEVAPMLRAGPVTAVGRLVTALTEAGVDTVTGDIVGDDDRYDREYSVPEWELDERPSPHGALLVNRGLLFGSTYGLNPAQSAANEMLRQLRAAGIDVVGRSRSRTATDRPVVLTVLGRTSSAPLAELVPAMLATRDRTGFEMLVKELGYQSSGEGTRAAGVQHMRDTLHEWGVDQTDIEMVDGSGTAPANRLSCSALHEVLTRLERWAPGATRWESASPVGVGLTVEWLAGDSGSEVLDAVFVDGSPSEPREGITVPARRDESEFGPG